MAGEKMSAIIEAIYSQLISSGTAAGTVSSLTGIDVPLNATAAILLRSGYNSISNRTSGFDISNFDADSDNHFVHITSALQGIYQNQVIAASYLLYGQTGFPSRGATSITLTHSSDGSTDYGSSSIVLLFLSGTVTDTETFIIGSQYITGATANWQSPSLGTVTSADIAIIGATQYSSDTISGAPSGSGQTEIYTYTESTVDTSYGYKLGEDQPILINGTSYSGAIAFAIKGASAEPSSILPMAANLYRQMR